MLNKLANRKNLTVIGVNSGTSGDGLDLAAVKVRYGKPALRAKFLFGKTISFAKNISSRLQEAIIDRSISLEKAMILDRELGGLIGREVSKFIKTLKRKKITPHIIASHGQTIRHLPGRVRIGRKPESATLQLGHPESIAAQTGLITIADFRQSDIAAGGEGSPITSRAMWHLFPNERQNRLMINIGGIANYFFIPAGTGPSKLIARDCGPGNSLMDIVCRKYFKRAFDTDGRLASRGKVSQRLLSILLADDYLKGKFGPSTGRERFGQKFVSKIVRYGTRLKLNKYDIMATTAELTVATVLLHVKKLIDRYDFNRLYLFGGGAKNKYIVNGLKESLPEHKIEMVERLGFGGDYLEAVCYAVMGAMTIWGMPGNLPGVTNATRETVCGKIITVDGK